MSARVARILPFGRHVAADRDVSRLLREHQEARSKRTARLAFVHGPSGVGKRELLEEVGRRLGSDGTQTFVMGGRGESTPHGLFQTLVPELLAHLTEVGIPAATLSALSQRLAPLRGDRRARQEEGTLDLADALAEAVTLAGRSCPLFLLQDVESADRSSLDLLRYVLAAVQAPGAEAAGLWVLGYRDDVALPGALAEVVSRASGVSIGLAGLDLEGIRTFLARREVAERLLDLTGGLPSVLEQVIASPPESRPDDLFLRRIERLAEPERDALHALALGACTADAGLLGSVVTAWRGHTALDLESRLERIASSRLLEARGGTGEPTKFLFAREADREALLRTVTPADRIQLHLAWAAEFERDASAPERAARHLLEADPLGRGRAAALSAAEVLASRLALDDATDLLLSALKHTPRAEQGPIHRRLADLFRAQADFVAALRHVGRWRATLPTEARRPARAEAARLLVTLGRLDTAERLLARVLGGLEPKADALDEIGLRAAVDLVEVTFLRGRYDEALSLGGRLETRVAADFELAYGLANALGKAHLARGEYAEALVRFTANESRALTAGKVREAAQAVLNQGVVAHRRGDKRSAVALYRRVLPELDRKSQAHALSNLGSLHAEAGEFDTAVEHLSRALTAFSRAKRRKEVAHCAGNLARLHLFLGELPRAAELAEHMGQVASQVGDPYLQASATLIRAGILEAQGESRAALEQFRSARAGFEQISSPRYAAESTLGLARAALAAGERAEARLALVSSVVDTQAAAVPALSAERDLVAGELALLTGDLSEATRRLSRAKETLLAEPDLEGPFRVYALLAKLRAAAGDPSGAAADVARAGRLLDELAAKVGPVRRHAFLSLPRRSQVLAAAAEREITPARVARALDLGLTAGETSTAMVGRCEAVQRVTRMLPKVAASGATVLIRGESGTGKELIAEAIHQGSQRREMPLVKVNCAAMVEELLMSELFGHEKGAFTGAVRERKGRFELAEGGTLFLDEIGDISAKAQVALLRVLQEREYERVGGTRTLRADVRVICATHRDLEAMIAAGQFRLDLYYRLKGVVLELPALRERGDDISLLCTHLLQKIANERREEVRRLTPEALELLQGYAFPGNIRELENVLSSASIFSQGAWITVESFDHLPELRAPQQVEPARPTRMAVASRPVAVAAPAPVAVVEPVVAPATPSSSEGVDFYEMARVQGLGLKELRAAVEQQCIARALAEGRGNISEAARLLKMKRSRLSQIVNGDPALRGLAKGDSSGADHDEGGDEEESA